MDHRKSKLLGVCAALALFSPSIFGATIETVDVFTVDGLTYEIEQARLAQQIKVPVNVRQIDRLYKLEMELSTGLPANEEKASQMAAERIGRLSKSQVLSMYSETAEALTMARTMGVTKVPAVVFNGRWIVYGLDPLQAHAQFARLAKEGRLN